MHRTFGSPITAKQSRGARFYLRRIFDNTAADYDRIESMLALGIGSRYRRETLQRGGLKAGMKVRGGVSTGVLVAGKLPKSMVLPEGRAETLPFPDNHFDFLSMGYALRHVSKTSTGDTQGSGASTGAAPSETRRIFGVSSDLV